MSGLALLLTLPGFDPNSRLGGLDAPQLAREALAMAKRIGAPAVIAEALRAAHEALPPEAVAQRLDIATDMLALAEQIGGWRLELLARSLRANAYLLLGRTAEADRELEAYDAIATASKMPLYLWSATTKLSMRAYMRGDLASCEALMERAHLIGLHADPNMAPVTYVWQSFFVRREQDRLAELEATLVDGVDAHRGDWSGAFWLGLLAVLYADTGRIERASNTIAEVLGSGTGAVLQNTVSNFRVAALALLADACAAIGDKDVAPSLVAAMEAHDHLFISPGNNPVVLGPVAHYLARVYVTLGQREKAEAHFRAALAAEERARAPILKAHTLCAYAGLLASYDDGIDDARRLLDEASDIANQFALARVRGMVIPLRRSLTTCRSP